MPTKLEQLLADIDPERTYDQTFVRADDALNSFPTASGRITDWEEFNRYMGKFANHVEAKILRMQQACPMGVDFEWGRCTQVLTRAYGPNGEKAAFEMARTGNEGGLFAVLKAVALGMAEEHAEAEVTARIMDCWNGLTLDGQVFVIDEYLAKHSHLLPSELTEGSAARIRADFPKVLAQHPQILQKTRHLGK